MRTLGRRWGRAALPGLSLLLAACGGLSRGDAIQLVKDYDQRLVAAYRAGDERLVDEVVGDEEGKKLVGLIGVKLDMGVSLDAKLLSFEPVTVERRGDRVEVVADERWYYQDRRIGSGERVGPDSTDHYLVRYVLTRPKKRWVVDHVEFVKPPEVGRTEALNRASPSSFHGLVSAPADTGGAPRGAR